MTVDGQWGEPNGAERPHEKQRGPVVLRRSRLSEPTTTDQRLLDSRGPSDWVHTDPWRVLRIQSEFVEGFGLLAELPRAVSVFGSARTAPDHPHYAAGVAIGAALAQPHRLPVLGTGDGGFLMGIAELETAVRLGLPLVCVVYDDAAYGAEVHHFAGDGDAPLDTVVFPDADIAAIGRGFGADGVVVRSAEDLAAVRTWLDGPRDRPLVIDAKIASDGGAWWLAEAFRGH